MAESSHIYSLVRALAHGFCRLGFGLKTEGSEHLPPGEPYLLICNHASFFDPIIVASATYRQIGFLARASLFRIPLLGGLIRILGAIPVERGGQDRRSIRGVLGKLRRGSPVLVFPEGTRGRGPELLPFKRGFLLIVKQSGVPLVPVVILGSERALPRGRVLPRPVGITVRYGMPVSAGEALHLGAEGIREQLQRLRDGA